jgi:hypothetical protein
LNSEGDFYFCPRIEVGDKLANQLSSSWGSGGYKVKEMMGRSEFRKRGIFISFLGMSKGFPAIRALCFSLISLFFPVITMEIVTRHSTGGGCHLACRWEYKEVRGCLIITLATILDPNSFS